MAVNTNKKIAKDQNKNYLSKRLFNLSRLSLQLMLEIILSIKMQIFLKQV